MNTHKNNLTVIAFAITIACVAILCIFIQGNYLVNGNISWLLMGADRLLDGHSLSQHIYEPNPPLSLIIYMPHVLFAKLTGLAIPVASFYVTFLLAILSTLATHAIIKRFDFLTKGQHLAFIACYTISITLITTVFFSDREHFILLGLAPMMLTQFALMEKITLPKALVYVVLAIGAICILIKPHFGLLPTIFLLARLIKHRKINILKEPDFIALSAATILYVGIIFIVFSDFVNVIFPDVISLYLFSGKELLIVLEATKLYTLIFVCALFFELFREDLKKEQKRFVIFLYICCILCMIPYYVQLKGFYNHLIPAYGFFTIGLGTSILLRLDKVASKLPSLQVIIPFVCIMVVTNNISPLNNEFPTHDDIRHYPVAKFLEEECPKPCTFFTFHGDIEIFNPTAALMGHRHGTRFPTYWFLPSILTGVESDDPAIKKQALYMKDKYLEFVAEDFKHYAPSILLIARDLPLASTGKDFNFIEFFGTHPELGKHIEENYEKTGIFKFDRGLYFKGTTLEDEFILDFDIYKKRN